MFEEQYALSCDGALYRIRVGGHLADYWSAWFDGLTIERTTDGTTLISGHFADQAALHGAIGRIRDLGLILLAVERLDEMR